MPEHGFLDITLVFLLAAVLAVPLLAPGTIPPCQFPAVAQLKSVPPVCQVPFAA